MASRDHFVRLASEIQFVLNTHHLAFRTYNLNDLSEMFKRITGAGAGRIDDKTGPQFEQLLLERGFLCYPSVADAVSSDGYIRVIRAGSWIANILSALRYPGPGGDDQLARLLSRLKAPQGGFPDASSGDELA
jgi:hypothetical protein